MLSIFQLYLAKEETAKTSFTQGSFTGSEENVDEITATENGSFESEAS